MARLYFDKPKGIILIDGVKCDSKFARTSGAFCLQYFPFDNALNSIFYACDGRILNTTEVCFIKHGKDYIVKFCPIKKPIREDEETYLQIISSPTEGKSHCLSCVCSQRHKIVVETESEIFYINIPAKATSCDFKCANLHEGQLLTIFAKLENGKTFVCALHYLDDYTPLLSLSCDEVYCEEDGLRICDRLDDTMARTCVRKISFVEDGFTEISRHFEYACDHIYNDELIPYVFLESLNCRDEECIQNLVSYSMKDIDFRTYFGDFIEICDCLDYSPYVVTLVYSGEEGFYTRTYKFCVTNKKITKVNLL